VGTGKERKGKEEKGMGDVGGECCFLVLRGWEEVDALACRLSGSWCSRVK